MVAVVGQVLMSCHSIHPTEQSAKTGDQNIVQLLTLKLFLSLKYALKSHNAYYVKLSIIHSKVVLMQTLS